jgi:hypothetical protein
MTLVPALITVNPAPSLVVDYFIQTFVQGDNPFTQVRKRPMRLHSHRMRLSTVDCCEQRKLHQFIWKQQCREL